MAAMWRHTADVAGAAVCRALLRVVHALYATLFALEAVRVRLPRWRRPDLSSVQVPGHVGVVLASAAGPAELRSAAAAASWLASAGVRYVTLCDAHGDLVRSAREFGSALHAAGCTAPVLAAGEPPPSGKAQVLPPPGRRDAGCEAGYGICGDGEGGGCVGVRLVSMRTGRDDLVLAARRLCERVVSGRLRPNVDEAVLDAEVSANAGFPEPDLILQCGPELHLGGLLPWHCRISQYAHIGQLGAGSGTRRRVLDALEEYGRVEQRHGR